MQNLPHAFAPLRAYQQFILWSLVTRDGKPAKLPISPHTLQSYQKGSNWQQDPAAWTDADTALSMAALAGPGYGVGFLFTAADPFFFVDLDNCLSPDGQSWSPVAMDILGRLPGAAIEVSQSGQGLHIFGTGAMPDHGCRGTPHGLELYTSGRFVALTGNNAIGSADTDCSAALPDLVTAYFPRGRAGPVTDWTDAPVPEWDGPDDDAELIRRALASTSAGAAFGGRSSFATLWAGDTSGHGGDDSAADAALAQHLAFWTGSNCERVHSLMLQSGLARDKWDREDYLPRTILKAVSLQHEWYRAGGIVDDAGQQLAADHGAVTLRGAGDAQVRYAESIRSQKLAECGDQPELLERLGQHRAASWWIDNKALGPDQLGALLMPVEHVAAASLALRAEPELLEGYQYLGAPQQVEWFRGCVYIQDLHRVFTPDGALLKSEQFNATFGGYTFQMSPGDRGKTTKKAWEAFTESQAVRFPKAASSCFRPALPPGALIEDAGRVLVNTYVPIQTRRLAGDPTPFLQHLEKLLPDPGDRSILLAYMAACIQHKGTKFQWAPLVQGVEGNGKTLLTRCVAFAIGRRYTHMPKAKHIDGQFNGWILNKLFIGVEDIFVPESRQDVLEALKPMITGGDEITGMEVELKGVDQIVADVCANFMLNSNHRDALRKTRNDRRFCNFFTAQQDFSHLARDGMDGDYFPRIYTWLKSDGYAIVADYLERYAIPDALNPAGACHRAPETTSTLEAIAVSMGGIEQEILEAVEEGRPGFAGGWISSVAVERLLHGINAKRSIPHNRRRELLQSLGYDWHPALPGGRTNNPIPLDENKKPRLFIREGHIHANLTGPAEVARAYQEAQNGTAVAGGNRAAEAFNNVQ
jgi:hypothetical protein